jgi:hypothetical protein
VDTVLGLTTSIVRQEEKIEIYTSFKKDTTRFKKYPITYTQNIWISKNLEMLCDTECINSIGIFYAPAIIQGNHSVCHW